MWTSITTILKTTCYSYKTKTVQQFCQSSCKLRLSWMLNLKILNFQSTLWRQITGNFDFLLCACESFVRVCSALLPFKPNIFFTLLTTRHTMTAHLDKTMKNIEFNIYRRNRLDLPKSSDLFTFISRLQSEVFRKLSAIFAWLLKKLIKMIYFLHLLITHSLLFNITIILFLLRLLIVRP